MKFINFKLYIMKSIVVFYIILFSALFGNAQENRELFYADPTIYVDNGKYYLTGTGGRRGGSSGFNVLESEDLKNWTLPTGANDSVYMILTQRDHTYGTRGFWAPQILKVDETYLTLSLTSSVKNLYDAAEKFKIFSYDSFIFTKIDEAVTHGSLLNLSVKHQIPVIYLTNGQIIPDDILSADSENIANLIYNGSFN